MATAVVDMPAPRRGFNRRLWCLSGMFVTGAVALNALSEWRERHLFLVNATASLPNWAFLIDRARRPERGDYLFFDPPASPLLRRHFGIKPRMFGKIVYGVAGDRVAHDGAAVTLNGQVVARMKPVTRLGERLTPGAAGRVPEGCYFVATAHPDGFDSRYAEIGFVCAPQIVGVGEPIL